MEWCGASHETSRLNTGCADARHEAMTDHDGSRRVTTGTTWHDVPIRYKHPCACFGKISS